MKKSIISKLVEPGVVTKPGSFKKAGINLKVLWLIFLFVVSGFIIFVINYSGQQENVTKADESSQEAETKPPPSVGSRIPQPNPGHLITNSIGMKLVYIPPGEFMMGSRDSASEVRGKYGGGKEEYANEHPQHKVRISKGFYMGIYEVTREQYRAIMGKQRIRSDFWGENLPIEKVSWNDATEFCQKLSQKEGKIYSLPTEAQWEYACRAGTTTPFYFGETISHERDRNKTTEVGSFPPNAFGLYDMYGNVSEWCQDWYDGGNYSDSPEVDPKGATPVPSPPPSRGRRRDTVVRAPRKGDKPKPGRIVRGGSFAHHVRCCRSSDRSWSNPDARYSICGFRVVVLDAAAKQP